VILADRVLGIVDVLVLRPKPRPLVAPPALMLRSKGRERARGEILVDVDRSLVRLAVLSFRCLEPGDCPPVSLSAFRFVAARTVEGDEGPEEDAVAAAASFSEARCSRLTVEPDLDFACCIRATAGVECIIIGGTGSSSICRALPLPLEGRKDIESALLSYSAERASEERVGIEREREKVRSLEAIWAVSAGVVTAVNALKPERSGTPRMRVGGMSNLTVRCLAVEVVPCCSWDARAEVVGGIDIGRRSVEPDPARLGLSDGSVRSCVS